MPVHDTNINWLHEAVNSVLNQTFQSFEFIIVDNGSRKLETLDYINKLQNNSKIKILRLKYNFGISVACNIGIKNSQYDYIARMDSDDICFPMRFEKQFEYMRENSHVDVLGSNCTFMSFENNSWNLKRNTNHPISIDKKVIDTSLWFINHPTVMYKKNSVLDIEGYDESLDCIVEDYDLWIRMFHAKKNICNLPDILLYYRQHEYSYTKRFRVDQYKWQRERRDIVLNNKLIKRCTRARITLL